MLEEIVANIVMWIAVVLVTLGAIGSAIGWAFLCVLYAIAVALVYGLAYCILPFVWTWSKINALFKSRS